MSGVSPARDAFEVPEGIIYLRGHAVGCLPRAARGAATRFFDSWAARGADAWETWIETIGAFQSALALVLGARPEELAPQVNVSSALTKVIGSLPKQKGRRRIVYGELDFPTLGFVCQKAASLGYEPSCVPAEGGMMPLSVWDQHLTEDVALAHITHVLSDSGYQVDVAGVLRLCRERGIFAVVDIAQSAGVVPIDLAAWGATCAIGCSVKWLCGGPGASYLWIHRDVLPTLQPIDVGWFSHARPFDLDIHQFEYADDARRFWGGTPSVLPFAIATTGLSQIHALGMDRIRAHNLALTNALRQAALSAGLVVHTPLEEAQRGGTIAIAFPDDAAAVKRLGERGVQVDRRRSGLRFSPHIYNTRQEIDRVCSLIAELA